MCVAMWHDTGSSVINKGICVQDGLAFDLGKIILGTGAADAGMVSTMKSNNKPK
jgi:hypothetical protein